MSSFNRAVTLRGLIHDRLLPSGVDRLYRLLDRLLGTTYTGDLRMETSDSAFHVYPETSSKDPAFQAWAKGGHQSVPQSSRIIRNHLKWNITSTQRCSHLFHRGATYSATPEDEPPTSRQGRNSTIQYRCANGDIAVGRITYIVHHGVLKSPTTATSNTKILVQRYKSLPPDQQQAFDVFRKWPLLGGRLVIPAFESNIDVIETQDIISHVAFCPFRCPTKPVDEAFLVIWPLDRVRALNTSMYWPQR